MSEQQLGKNESDELKNNSSEEMEINLLEILRKIISIRKTLYKAAGIGLIVGIVVAISIPKQYTVNVTLSPEMGSPKGNSGLAGIAASFLGNGATTGDTSDALNFSLSSDIVSSTPFLLELLSMNIVRADKGGIETLTSYLEKQSSPWWNYIIGFPGVVISGINSLFTGSNISSEEKKQQGGGAIELTKDEVRKISFLKNNISVSIDKKTAITNITISLQDPKVAAFVADSVVHKLQEYIIDYRTFKAKEDCAYLEKLFKERREEYYVAQKKYAEYVDAHDNLILQSVRAEQERLQNDMGLAYQVYSQVANQLQVARAKVQEEKPVFAVVEPAVVPLQASGMGAKIYVLLFVFAFVFCTLAWILFVQDLLIKLKNKI